MTQEKPRREKGDAPKKGAKTRFLHLGAGFFLDRKTGQVVAL